MEENKKEKKENTEKPEKKRLSADSTVLLSVAGALIAVVVLRVIYWIITGV